MFLEGIFTDDKKELIIKMEEMIKKVLTGIEHDGSYISVSVVKEAMKELIKLERERILEILRYNPYPTDIFPQLSKTDLKRINNDMINGTGIPLDRLSAHIGRELRKGIIKEIKKSSDKEEE